MRAEEIWGRVCPGQGEEGGEGRQRVLLGPGGGGGVGRVWY